MIDAQIPPRSSRHRRLRLVLSGLAVVAVFGGGWVAALSFQSPAQREADAQAPTPVPVTASVERGSLDDVVTLSATVAADTRVERTLPGIPEGVVTGVPLRAGQSLAHGAVIAEISGRPLFALAGAFPFYRDLGEGASGPDVKQLQVGLGAAGYAVAPDGSFGTQTLRALRAFYAASGYPAATFVAASADAPGPGADGGDAARSSDRSIVAAVTDFLVVPVLPATAISVPAVGATEADAAHLVVASGSPIIQAQVPAGVAQRLSEGLTGVMRRPGRGDVAVVLSHLAAPEKEGEGDHRVSFRVDGPALTGDDIGATGVVAVTVEAGARDALLVPTRAVSGRGGNDAVVRRVGDEGALVEVRVEELGTLNGRTAVRATAGALDDGDDVVVE